SWFLLIKDSTPKLARDKVVLIKAGMNLGEVQAIVGTPPDFSSKGPETTKGIARWAPAKVTWITAQGWISDDAELTVLFDEQERVVDRRYYPPPDRPLPMLDRIANRAKYEWKLFWK